MTEPEQARRDVTFVMRLVLIAFIGTIVLFVRAGKLPAAIKDVPVKLLFLSLGWIGWRRFSSDPAPGEVRRSVLPMAGLGIGNAAGSQACALLLVVPLVTLGARVNSPSAGALSLTAVALSWLINVGLTVPGEELLYRGAVLTWFQHAWGAVVGDVRAWCRRRTRSR